MEFSRIMLQFITNIAVYHQPTPKSAMSFLLDSFTAVFMSKVSMLPREKYVWLLTPQETSFCGPLLLSCPVKQPKYKSYLYFRKNRSNL